MIFNSNVQHFTAHLSSVITLSTMTSMTYEVMHSEFQNDVQLTTV